MKNTKILVLGSGGMVGHLVTLYLLERGHNITAYSRRPFHFCRNIIGDAFEINKLGEILKTEKYDLVVNCIGLLIQEVENNPSNGVFLNSYLPHYIADQLTDQDSKLIHISTDCVFAGNTGPYYEDSFPNGLALYDRTKALGEINDEKNLTFRNSFIGPDLNKNGIGLFNWFMNSKDTVQGYTDAIWTGVTTITLAQAIEHAIEEEITGIYHLVNNQSISKYDLLLLFNQTFRNNSVTISPSDKLHLDKTLVNLRKDFSFIVPSYIDQMSQMKEWIEKHSDLYPHYIDQNR